MQGFLGQIDSLTQQALELTPPEEADELVSAIEAIARIAGKPKSLGQMTAEVSAANMVLSSPTEARVPESRQNFPSAVDYSHIPQALSIGIPVADLIVPMPASIPFMSGDEKATRIRHGGRETDLHGPSIPTTLFPEPMPEIPKTLGRPTTLAGSGVQRQTMLSPKEEKQRASIPEGIPEAIPFGIPVAPPAPIETSIPTVPTSSSEPGLSPSPSMPRIPAGTQDITARTGAGADPQNELLQAIKELKDTMVQLKDSINKFLDSHGRSSDNASAASQGMQAGSDQNQARAMFEKMKSDAIGQGRSNKEGWNQVGNSLDRLLASIGNLGHN